MKKSIIYIILAIVIIGVIGFVYFYFRNKSNDDTRKSCASKNRL